MTVLEEQFTWHLRASDETHRESAQLLKKLDERADKQELRMYGLVAALTVLGVLGQAFLPLIRDLLRLPA